MERQSVCTTVQSNAELISTVYRSASMLEGTAFQISIKYQKASRGVDAKVNMQSDSWWGALRGLVYCMEYLEESLDEWLGDELEAFGEDDYVVFDCPGQIELYTNTSVFRSFIRFLQSAGWQVGRCQSAA